MGYVLAGSLSLLLMACSGGGSADDQGDLNNVEKRCLRMRDHLIDVRLQTAAVEPSGSSLDVARANSTVAQHRDALIAALGEDFGRRCASNMSIAQIDCVLAAEDSEAVVGCSVPR
jgi:hypothetical protein